MGPARLRSAFHYPSDTDTDSLPPQMTDEKGARMMDEESAHMMDEEEQEALLLHLRQTDHSTNELYSSLFSLLFILPSIYTLLLLLRKPSLLSFLGLSSLGMTVYTVKFIPVPVPGGGGGGGAVGEGGRSEEMLYGAGAGGGGGGGGGESPLEKVLPVLNGFLAAVVGVGVCVQGTKGVGIGGGNGGGGAWGEMGLEAWAGYLPLLVYGLSVVVRYAMTPLDLSELEKMRYKYKGA